MTNEQEPESGSAQKNLGRNKDLNKSKNAGGFFLAGGCIVGTIGGGLLGQPSIGLLAGLATGGLIALAIWYFDR